ncbi:MAG: CvpA family protein [Bacteroidales bacterium]|jgi:membrane protein required for colicin V production
MHFLDVVIGVPLLWTAFKGFRKGLILEILSIITLIVAVYGGIHFSYFTANLLGKYIHSGFLQIISFAVTFILILIGLYWFAKILEKFVDAIALGFANKITGCFFGLLKMAFIISCIIYIAASIDSNKILITEKTISNSLLYKPVSAIAPAVFPILKTKYEQIKDKSNLQKH